MEKECLSALLCGRRKRMALFKNRPKTFSVKDLLTLEDRVLGTLDSEECLLRIDDRIKKGEEPNEDVRDMATACIAAEFKRKKIDSSSMNENTFRDTVKELISDIRRKRRR